MNNSIDSQKTLDTSKSVERNKQSEVEDLNCTAHKDNFEIFVKKLVYTVKTTNNYNPECFGMSDIKLAMRMDYVLDQFIQRVVEANYCPYALMHSILKEFDMFIREESKQPLFKQIADESLVVDMRDFAKDIDYCNYVWDLHKVEIV